HSLNVLYYPTILQITDEDTANHNFQETWQQPPKSRHLVKANSATKSSATEQ
ncbi:Uncharacterized protein DAT39_011703, partial [Clarias magur]